jgi:hypothetical protein
LRDREANSVRYLILASNSSPFRYDGDELSQMVVSMLAAGRFPS